MKFFCSRMEIRFYQWECCRAACFSEVDRSYRLRQFIILLILKSNVLNIVIFMNRKLLVINNSGQSNKLPSLDTWKKFRLKIIVQLFYVMWYSLSWNEFIRICWRAFLFLSLQLSELRSCENRGCTWLVRDLSYV